MLILSVRRMSKLPAALLLQWGQPLWQLRTGGLPPFFENAEKQNCAFESVQKSPEKASDNKAFSGVFVPEDLSEQAQVLLKNIQKAFPALPALSFTFEQVEALLMSEAGSVWVFGEPQWSEDIADLPVAVVYLPDLEAMLEDPWLKKQCYITLLQHFT